MQSAHQVFRKYETYNINVHAVIIFAPPILLTLFTKHTVLPALLGNFVTYLSTLVLSILVYRISPIHPLARYPGPIGCKVSKFWMGCICIPGFQHQYIKSLHERYGDVVRIGTPFPHSRSSVCVAREFGERWRFVTPWTMRSLGSWRQAVHTHLRLNSFPP